MGWGVNDDETFAALLERKLGKKVYNLAVSGFATKRELERLRISNLLEKVDIIIIQYSNNDYHENLSSINKINSVEENKKKFSQIASTEMSFFERLQKGIRYSFTIPFHLIKNKKNNLDWYEHEESFYAIIKEYNVLNKKKLIVIYSNGLDQNFKNFPDKISAKFPNLQYINIPYSKDDFFLVDGHLNIKGHKKVADILYKLINKI